MLYAGVAAVAAAAGIAGAWWRERNDSGVAATGGEKLDAAMFWDQRFERPEGGELALSSLRGKPVLLNFWATWCPPCVEEMPMIDTFFREHGANGWQVVGLAIDLALRCDGGYRQPEPTRRAHLLVNALRRGERSPTSDGPERKADAEAGGQGSLF
jgi:thiol-disulfide isomerase/thioredoxin